MLARSAPARVTTLPSAALLWRVYFGDTTPAWRALRSFGPLASARFDHHDEPQREQRRAVLYAALEPTTCLAEAFQVTRLVDPLLRRPHLVAFRITRDVPLLDLTGTWPTRAGASMALHTGRRDRSRRWSRAVHLAFPHIEGLLYPSSMHANRPAVLLYERAASSIPARPELHRALGDATILPWIRSLLATIGYVLR